ncbi:MAG: hypothetical protein P3A32_03790 [Gemmatimonadota bacterium]|jgi:hypothetical protein|nr:hypothetical protein [Gemmatimonadota bacterium]MDQ8146783.1 hypothetical protein [Gemmatimonadota bacterium]MDQ8148933.1 hypothetical protein [Gemmatimonadota bacterium]MDQ8156930.1 hypothetical protein [Gemmatimonadota bacterium]MDQ8176136.1 hypothetical protein [Gemmatimonadota bacterium]
MATPTKGGRAPLSRIIPIGCFMTVIGAFSGGMVAVLISMGVAKVTAAPACDGIPTCNWHYYWGVGALLGALSLPWLVVSALRAAPPADAASPDSPQQTR